MKNAIMKKVLATILAATMIVGMTACGGGSKTEEPAAAPAENSQEEAAAPAEDSQEEAAAPAVEGKKYIALCLYGLDNEAWAAFIEGANDFVAQLPEGAAQVDVLTSGGDDNVQIEGIRSYIASHGKDAVFFIDPSSKANTVNLVEVCEEAGVFYTIEAHRAEGLSPWENDHFVAHINQDDFNAGYTMGKQLFEELGGEGDVFDLYGALGNDAATAREAGFQEALKEYPNINLVDTQVANFSQQDGLDIVETWLASYADTMDGIFSANDSQALGAIDALKEHQLEGKVKVVGIDGVSQALQAIKDGNLLSTIYLNTYGVGGYGASYAYYASTGEYDFLNGKPENRMIYTETFPVTADNVDELIGNTPSYDFTLEHLEDIISGYQKPEDIEIPY